MTSEEFNRRMTALLSAIFPRVYPHHNASIQMKLLWPYASRQTVDARAAECLLREDAPRDPHPWESVGLVAPAGPIWSARCEDCDELRFWRDCVSVTVGPRNMPRCRVCRPWRWAWRRAPAWLQVAAALSFVAGVCAATAAICNWLGL